MCLAVVCMEAGFSQIWSQMLLHFKLSKSGQFLRVDKTGFPRPGHKYTYIITPYHQGGAYQRTRDPRGGYNPKLISDTSRIGSGYLRLTNGEIL